MHNSAHGIPARNFPIKQAVTVDRDRYRFVLNRWRSPSLGKDLLRNCNTGWPGYPKLKIQLFFTVFALRCPCDWNYKFWVVIFWSACFDVFRLTIGARRCAFGIVRAKQKQFYIIWLKFGEFREYYCNFNPVKMSSIKYIGRTTDFKGKTLWEIVGNLKNFGVGRVVVRSMFERYPEPSYMKIVKVETLPNEVRILLLNTTMHS